MINLKCPSCGQKFEADDSFIGQWIDCQTCGEKFFLEDWKTQCMSCHKWFNVQDYEGATKCPHCGNTTGKHTPEEIKGWEDAERRKATMAEEARKKLRREAIGGFILFVVVLALVVWGVSFCVGKYRANRKAELEYAKEHGTIGMAKSICKEHLLKGIISPASAKITFEREEERGDNLYAFAGYIDAQNSSGAMIRNKFVVVVSYNPDKGYRVEASDISP